MTYSEKYENSLTNNLYNTAAIKKEEALNEIHKLSIPYIVSPGSSEMWQVCKASTNNGIFPKEICSANVETLSLACFSKETPIITAGDMMVEVVAGVWLSSDCPM